MPAVTTNAVATDCPVNASSTKESVTPVSAEYATKSSEAVPGAMRSTDADSPNTMPSCAIINTQKSRRLDAMVTTSAREEATTSATIAVTPSPTNIQP